MHLEEELLIVIDGEAQVIVGEEEKIVQPLKRGDFVYYPAYQRHTIRNDGATPITYLMFKWSGLPLGLEGHLEMGVFRDGGEIAGAHENRFRTKLELEGPTHFLNRIHVHRSYVLPSCGYKAHRDGHDVLITLLEGRLETMSRIIEAPALLYHPAGTLHGLRSVGEYPASYVVVEMHGRQDQDAMRSPIKALFSRWF